MPSIIKVKVGGVRLVEIGLLKLNKEEKVIIKNRK